MGANQSEVALAIPPLPEGTDGDAASLVAGRIEAFERWLPQAVEGGSVEELGRLAHDARIAALDQQRRGYESIAARLGELALRAQAGIGLIDLRQVPPRAINTDRHPLLLSDGPVPGRTRR